MLKTFYSAIVNNKAALRHMTAYDRANGHCENYDFCRTNGRDFWQSFLKLLDCRLSKEKEPAVAALVSDATEHDQTPPNKAAEAAPASVMK